MAFQQIRRTLPGIVLAVGLMTMALSCGGSSESSAMASHSDTAAEMAAASQGPAGELEPQGGLSANGGISANGDSEKAGSFAPAAQAAATAVPQAAMAPAPASAPAAARPASLREETGEQQRSQAQPQSGRQLIVEAWVGLEVSEIDATVRQVEALATQRRGWMESAEIFGEGGYRAASLRVRVPADLLDNTMDALRGLGRVVDEGISATDVTERLIDNAARLEAWYTQEKRLVELLEDAPTVEDIIQIERRISEVRSDIEHVEATQRSLTNRVATSLITIHLHLPSRFAADPPYGALTLFVGDPSATAETIAARVEGLKGYIGEKSEYDEGRGRVVDMGVFVKSSDLSGLMDYVATLGEPVDRQLNSVGPPPASDVPNAHLKLNIRSDVDLGGSLSLDASQPLEVGSQIRERAEALGGFVETWHESKEGDFQSVSMGLVVKSADLRDIMDFGASLGEVEHWKYNAAGRDPVDDAPKARLNVSVYTDSDDRIAWIIGGVIAAVVVVAAIVIVLAVVLARRRRGKSVALSAVSLEPDLPV